MGVNASSLKKKHLENSFFIYSVGETEGVEIAIEMGPDAGVFWRNIKETHAALRASVFGTFGGTVGIF